MLYILTETTEWVILSDFCLIVFDLNEASHGNLNPSNRANQIIFVSVFALSSGMKIPGVG
jgi:hypothetical protein